MSDQAISSQHKANKLINESSPYLLQHAHNLVDWHPWNPKTLQLARKRNKPLLVSIGYAACHWCHVMERESFVDEEAARIMNEHFICIKVDREERPDVDMVFMDAVQMISGRGGWPLNCFALPDGRPFWGATYFPKEQWIEVLGQVVNLYQQQHEKLELQAKEIAEGIQNYQFINPLLTGAGISSKLTDSMVSKFSLTFDRQKGGFRGAPKFPMPNNLQFLLDDYYFTRSGEILEFIELTLQKMAKGGIFDQLGGGFARYSVDDRWHIPHFEKMLYDNAQLVSLYSKAYQVTGNEIYREIADLTLGFVQRELTSPEGGFYSSVDADSEGEEGKFYTWSSAEMKQLLGDNFRLIAAYFGIDGVAAWEVGKNVLVQDIESEPLAKQFEMDRLEVIRRITQAKEAMFAGRSKRIPPDIDTKILTSWNALMIGGYIDAYKAFGNQHYYDSAYASASFLENFMFQKDGSLFRNYSRGKSNIDGMLDDYAFLAESMISLYEITCEEKWLLHARKLVDYSIAHFYNPETGLFYYTAVRQEDVVIRKPEIPDNVIPSSNSSLSRGLFKLGLLFDKREYLEISRRMIANFEEQMKRFPSAFSNWGMAAMAHTRPFYTIVLCGEQAEVLSGQINKYFLPNIVRAATKAESSLPMFRNRFVKGKSLIYLCSGQACLNPVETIEEMLVQLAKETT